MMSGLGCSDGVKVSACRSYVLALISLLMVVVAVGCLSSDQRALDKADSSTKKVSYQI